MATTLNGWSIPFFHVFSAFLGTAEGFYDTGNGSYAGYLLQMGVDPDLPITVELAGEHARIFEELNNMAPGTGDQNLDNETRDERYAVLLGEAYGRLVGAMREASPMPDQTEALFYGRLNEMTRASMSVTYLGGADPDRIVRLQTTFEVAYRRARAATDAWLEP